jgi:hypothetical protein
MQDDSDSETPVRTYLQLVAAEFKRLSRSAGTEAVLEPANAGPSFQDDLVRAKFRIKKRRDLNAAGIIVTAAEDEIPPDLPPPDVAHAILGRVEGIEDMRKGTVVRVAYREVPLTEIVDGI